MNVALVGQNITQLRKQHGLTQQGLSELTGITQPKICRLELGNNPDPQYSTLERIATALNCKVADLTGDCGPRSDLLNS